MEAGLGAYLDDLRSMVGIDCGTYTPEGVNRVADRCAERFGALGFEVERRRHRPREDEPQLGDCLIGTGTGPGPRWLYQSIHSAVANSTASMPRQGPRWRITSALYRLFTASARALS